MKEKYIAVELDLHKSDFGEYLFTHYEILEEFYRSDNSQIFKIKQNESDIMSALKAVQKKPYLNFDMDGFHRIQHENIVKVELTGESENYYYMVMEYIEGKTLEKAVETNGPCSIECVKKYIYQIYLALHYLHHHEDGQLIYRDLKPSNIMVSSNGKITLIDINTLRMKKDYSHSDTYYIGSRGFTAPEAYGYAQSTEASDVYSLGATIFFLLTGTIPSVGSQFHKEIKSSELNQKYKSIIIKSTKYNPKDRYQSVAAVYHTINQHLNIKKVLMLAIVFLILTLILGFGVDSLNTLNTKKTKVSKLDDAVSISSVETSDNDNLTNSLTDDDITNMRWADKGIKISKMDGYINIVYDRSDMDLSLKDFEYISVYTSEKPFDIRSMFNMPYGASIMGYGFQTYTDAGYNESIKNGHYFAVFIFDKAKKPIGYYISSDSSEL